MLSIGDLIIRPGKKLFLISGPCVIESRDQVFRVVEEILCQLRDVPVDFIFKTSYDKANRTSGKGYRGPGLIEGLKILQDVKTTFRIPVLTDVHTPEEAWSASEVLDALQIPAFLCRQTDLLYAAAQTQKPINLKKGQFLAPWDMKNVIQKIEEKGNTRILVTERGTCFGYNTLVNDFRSLPLMKEFGYPIVYDGTHSVQQPGGRGTSTGGERRFISTLTRAAVAAGADGLFLETHYDPDNALSDGPNMIPTSEIGKLIKTCLNIFAVVHDGSS